MLMAEEETTQYEWIAKRHAETVHVTYDNQISLKETAPLFRIINPN